MADGLKEEETELRRLFASDRNHPRLSDPHVFLVDAYQNRETFKYSPLDEQEKTFYNILNQKCLTNPQGYSINTFDQFQKNWAAFAPTLASLNWKNVFVAGGSILKCMMNPNGNTNGNQASPATTGDASTVNFNGSDIDLFLYDLTPEAANEKIKEIHAVVTRNSNGKPPHIIRTRYAITILGDYPLRHIQIVLRLYKSPAEVLIGFDVDACTVGFDGEKVWASKRARRALTKQYNLVDLSRRSLTYEVRLNKYSQRGFAVLIPGVNPSSVNPLVVQCGVREVTGLAKLLVYHHRASKAAAQQSNMNSYPPRSKAAKQLSKYVSSRDRRLMMRLDSSVASTIAGPVDAEDAGESDYQNEFIPWGAPWLASSILRLLTDKDKAQYFSRQKISHKHIFVSGIDGVLTGKSGWCEFCKKPSEDFGADAL